MIRYAGASTSLMSSLIHCVQYESSTARNFLHECPLFHSYVMDVIYRYLNGGDLHFGLVIGVASIVSPRGKIIISPV